MFCFSFKNLDWKPRRDGNNGDDDDDDDDDDGGGDRCDIDIVTKCMVIMIIINVEKNVHFSVLLFPVRLEGKYLNY